MTTPAVVIRPIDEQEQEYGVERLTEVVRQHRDLRTRGIVDAILADLAEHTGKRPAFDDVTLIVIKRCGSDTGNQ